MTTEHDKSESDAGDAAGREGNPLAAVSALMAERRPLREWISSARGPSRHHTRTRLHARARRLSRPARRGDPAAQEAHRRSSQRDRVALEPSGRDREEQQQRRDERAEAELRAHVGELSGEDWETMKSRQAIGAPRDGVSAQRRGAGAPQHARVAQRPRSARRLQLRRTRRSEPSPSPSRRLLQHSSWTLLRWNARLRPRRRHQSRREGSSLGAGPQVPRPSPLRVIHRTPAPGMAAIEQQPLEDEPMPPARQGPRRERAASTSSPFSERRRYAVGHDRTGTDRRAGREDAT